MSLEAEVRQLKEDRHAVLLAHNYQRPEVQDIADFVGDSLYLSRKAMETDRPVIVFAGVRFMAETAKILNPTRTVLLPDLKAGCGLADSITADLLRAWKAEHPGAVVVAYINTSAEVKAESDYCCTSSNAIKVVSGIPADQEILFLPDMFLGDYVRRRTGRAMHLWVGDCPVHAKMRPEDLVRARTEHPGAPVVAHPECGCASQVLPHVDHVLSTDGMVRFAEETRVPEVLVATEVGILHRMRQLNPTTKFTPLDIGTICPYMKEIDLTDIRDSLLHLQHVIDVPLETAARARRALERMVAS
ncbi:MAG: quinolinate synthase NadA [Thermoplasmata archaeon]|jgi:quinolinate synthase|nr:quinolinate synthase NadA [Thermoplasmata archaeon]